MRRAELLQIGYYARKAGSINAPMREERLETRRANGAKAAYGDSVR
jgi:hypothetical protein